MKINHLQLQKRHTFCLPLLTSPFLSMSKVLTGVCRVSVLYIWGYF